MPVGSDKGRTAHYAHLAVAKARAGDFVAARELIERSKSLVATTGERYHEPEIHRIDAELTLAAAGSIDRAPPAARARAGDALETAIACARRQGANTMELRATTMLVRVRACDGEATEARTRLAEILAGFTEGADTADVREARRLLAT
jgi:predicted ATPase